MFFDNEMKYMLDVSGVMGCWFTTTFVLAYYLEKKGEVFLPHVYHLVEIFSWTFFQDYVGNKRFELSGQLISLLFEVFIFLIVLLYVTFFVPYGVSFEGPIQNNEFPSCWAHE
jgi:hypothetical protein